MIDLLYLTFNRLEFTKRSLSSLLANTNWSLVNRLVIYDDGSTDGTLEQAAAVSCPKPVEIRAGSYGSPVAIMNDFLDRDPAALFAKIDNDVMLPSGWLDETAAVMQANPALDLLGIEAMYEVAPVSPDRAVIPAEFIGGIGLMRSRAFNCDRPIAAGRFGFTAWQSQHPQVNKGWLSPALPVCLLDRMPFAPWSVLSADYIARGWQRPWGAYGEGQSALWEWWQ